MIAGFSMVTAGLVLECVKELNVFKEITEIYILDVALLGLKGNLEMTLVSHLSTKGDIEGNTSYLQTPCLANLRGRQGLFLATHCIKLIAYSPEPNSIQYIYRTCSRDEGDDNGITRTSHCGFIKLDWINPNRRLRGCLHICDKDACNQAFNLCFSRWNMIFSLILLRLFFYIRNYSTCQ
ncbi:unnamed protein product [Adineta steineri]|uniref:Uncharacterized protein n=1 Tax=Adineta steineri TaxID=433720 RepID=A0A814Y0L6_9BILA|nr:unnamed protein product [Adineta steineri]CAF1514541.1 unnamed protein product [Adineta steineri]